MWPVGVIGEIWTIIETFGYINSANCKNYNWSRICLQTTKNENYISQLSNLNDLLKPIIFASYVLKFLFPLPAVRCNYCILTLQKLKNCSGQKVKKLQNLRHKDRIGWNFKQIWFTFNNQQAKHSKLCMTHSTE